MIERPSTQNERSPAIREVSTPAEFPDGIAAT
jgi:hypothetical protein